MYQIGDFKFNTKLAQLIAPCGKVHDLTPLAFHLLIYLVENNDRLINKRELILKVWKHEVSDSSINKTVSILRAMFDDCAQESRYIITRRKLGYRLVANVITNIEQGRVKGATNTQPIAPSLNNIDNVL